MLAFAIILIVPNVIVSQINKDLEFAYPLNMNGMLVEEVEPDKLLQQIMKQAEPQRRGWPRNRDVKNKDTGIDLTVTNYKETKALIGATYEYQVMIVSNLSYFKTPKHKESDNVQFTVLKKFNEFEELYTKLNTKFSGTVFPPLPKKVLMMSDAVAKERRAGLDHFVKYIAMTTKICTCSEVLEFLGVNAIKAGKFRKMEVSDAVVDKHNGAGDTAENEAHTEKQTEKQEAEEDLFETGEDQQEDDDLFEAEDGDTDNAGSAKMFSEQDLSGAFEEDAADDLFLPEARVEKKVIVTQSATAEDEEEEEDLFKIEDNLDEIMQLNLKPKVEETQQDDIKEEDNVQNVDSSPENTENTGEQEDADEANQGEINEEITTPEPEISVPKPEISAPKPEISAKPELKPKPKPKPAPRPKPPIKAKPSLNVENANNSLADIDSKSSQSETVLQKPVPSPRPKPPLKQKPQLAAKPNVKPKPKELQAPADTDSVANESGSLGGLPSENITEDDIMNYIQANTSGADEADLFS